MGRKIKTYWEFVDGCIIRDRPGLDHEFIDSVGTNKHCYYLFQDINSYYKYFYPK